MSVVLMYHALYRNDDKSDIDPEDLPYAVSEECFIAQLDAIAKVGAGLFDQTDTPGVVITFDDGHRSNLEIAAPLLLQRNIPAYFFITSEFIGKRPGFMDANELKSLAELPGMIIGSHGTSHRFFDDMSEDDSISELEQSKQALELLTGLPCESISFPGGRYNAQTLSQMITAGYLQWFGSEIGLVSQAEQFDMNTGSDLGLSPRLQTQLSREPLNRVAVRFGTQLQEFARMINPDAAYFLQHRRRRRAKNLLRQIVGNQLYHGLYKLLSSR